MLQMHFCFFSPLRGIIRPSRIRDGSMVLHTVFSVKDNPPHFTYLRPALLTEVVFFQIKNRTNQRLARDRHRPITPRSVTYFDGHVTNNGFNPITLVV